jgi:hypothetical protein
MRARLGLILLASALLGAGCTSSADDGGAEAIAASAGSLGILQIEQLGAAEAGASGPPAQLGAAFARYRGLSGDAVVGLLGGRAAGAIDACGAPDVGLDSLGAPDASVDLLDVGVIEVRVGEAEARLVPRTFPELARVAAGFFYAGDASLGEVRADLDVYTFRAEGSRELPGFEVAVPAPGALVEVRVGGEPATEAARVDVAREHDLELSWEGLDPRDQVELEFVSQGASVLCRARDDGSFRVPAASLAALGPDTGARLVMRRVRVQPFDAAGVDVAYVRVATTRVFDAVVR